MVFIQLIHGPSQAKNQLHKNTNIAEAIPETFYGLCSVEPAKTSRFLSYHCSLLAHDCLVGVLVDELVLPVSEHAAGELRRAVAPRHVRHAQPGPELGVVSRGVRQNTAPVVIVTTATGRAVTLSAEATRKLQEHRQGKEPSYYGQGILVNRKYRTDFHRLFMEEETICALIGHLSKKIAVP